MESAKGHIPTSGGHFVPPNAGSEAAGSVQPSPSLLPAKIHRKKIGKTITVTKDGKINPKGPYTVEGEPQKLAFAYYLSLGENRTLSQVADYFGKKSSLMVKWSSCFHWTERIKALQNRSAEDTFQEKAITILNLLLDSLIKNDESGRTVLNSTDRKAFDTLKTAVDAFRHLRDDKRADEEHQKEMTEGGKCSGKGPRGVQVNVLIQK